MGSDESTPVDLTALNRRGEDGVTIGRVVHYVTAHGAPRLYAAVVVFVYADGTTMLRVLHADGEFTAQRVSHAAAYKRGCWSWPTRG